MPNKTLTAKVKLNISDAESKLKRLNTLITSINKALGGKSNTSLEKNLNKQLVEQEKIAQATLKTKLAQEKLNKAVINTQIAQERLNQAELRTQAIKNKSLNQANQNQSKIISSTALVEQSASRVANAFGRATQQTSNLGNQIHRITGESNIINGTCREISSRLSGFRGVISNVVSKIRNWSSNQEQIKVKVQNIIDKTREWVNAQKQVKSNLNDTGIGLSNIFGKLKQIAQTYLGIMGVKAIANTSDVLTSAENRLNYVSANSLGNTGYNKDGTYSTQTLNATQDALDKMYASSKKVRMSYNDMMSNVSKTMSLAGNAFDNNIDNAIRFQEIMSEAYAVGGASAQEMQSSMYQLTQALGSGTLAGDELRSVREGAPLAYKAIEEFAQGVYNTEESLKDLASQGKITSDMVVAAIMKSGDKLDNAFAQTKQTFGQTMDQIKNAALYAFQPVMRMFSDLLNKAIDNGLVEKFEVLFTNLAKVVMIVVTTISKAIQWVVNNWGWLQHIIVTGLIIILSLFIVMKAQAAIAAIKTFVSWALVNFQFILIVATILFVIYMFYYLANSSSVAAKIICTILVLIGTVMAIVLISKFIAWLMYIKSVIIGYVLLAKASIIAAIKSAIAWMVTHAALALIILIIIAIVIAAIWLGDSFSEVCGYIVGAVFAAGTIILNIFIFTINLIAGLVLAAGQIIQNIISFIVNLIIGASNAAVALCHNAVAGIINLANGLWNVIEALGKNILIAFQNAWNGALSSFWNFIADCVEGLNWLAKPIAAIAKLFGKSFDVEDFSASLRAKAGGHQQQAYVSIGDAWSSGINTIDYKSVGDAWSSGWNTLGYNSISDISAAWSKGFNALEYQNVKSNFNKGFDIGENWGNAVEDKFNIGKSESKGSFLDGIGEKLGLDLSDMTGEFPKVEDPANSVANSYNQPDPKDLINGVGNIDNNTGKMADSMDLAEEDLSALKDIAERDWINKFTTAMIKVDMNNNNTINNKGDLGNWAVDLREMLEEELDAFANGVYA